MNKDSSEKNAVIITGCEYKPLESPVQLEAEFDYLISVMKDIQDPFE